jgi:hypothetical protein
MTNNLIVVHSMGDPVGREEVVWPDQFGSEARRMAGTYRVKWVAGSMEKVLKRDRFEL